MTSMRSEFNRRMNNVQTASFQQTIAVAIAVAARVSECERGAYVADVITCKWAEGEGTQKIVIDNASAKQPVQWSRNEPRTCRGHDETNAAVQLSASGNDNVGWALFCFCTFAPAPALAVKGQVCVAHAGPHFECPQEEGRETHSHTHTCTYIRRARNERMDVISCLPRLTSCWWWGKYKIPMGLSIHSCCSCTWSVHSKHTHICLRKEREREWVRGTHRHTPKPWAVLLALQR